MRFSKLQIAWSAGWGLFAILWIALWVRSYNSVDSILRRSPNANSTLEIQSRQGRLLVILRFYRTRSLPADRPEWNWITKSATEWEHQLELASGWGELTPDPQFVSIKISQSRWEFWIAHWISTLIIVIFALLPQLHSLPWIKRFSLRSMLVVTTFLSMALGLAIWALK